jgi:methyltransferase-like protein/trans-aconitate methyltransferase
MTDSYDEVAYPGSAFTDTHPDRMATIAQLLGMQPAPVDRCRVLELGCGDGINVISMAGMLPGSSFFGLDRAATPIARGLEIVRTIGLDNVRLEVMDLMDITPELGTFDYIIAHGVFSWVPEPVRIRILEICRQNLAPNGVAFISYLALPGSHLRNLFREVMLFHVRGREDPHERVQQARAIVRLIADTPGNDAYRDFARSLLDELERADDGVIYHDYLADINAPYYFVQFAELAAQHQLQFLSEAEYPAGFLDVEGAEPHVVNAVRQVEQEVMIREQYFDFLRCRRFRQSLLCHADVALSRPAVPERVAGMHVSGRIRPATNELDLAQGVIEAFRGAKGGIVRTDHPVAKAALQLLGETWPSTIAVAELLERARVATARDPAKLEEDRRTLCSVLLRCYEKGYIDLRTLPLHVTQIVSERPRASALARYQLRFGPMIANLRHENVAVHDDLGSSLVRLLDGTRDRPAIVAALTGAVAAGRAKLDREGRPVTDPAEAAIEIAAHLEEKLQQIAEMALLVS